MGKPGKTKVKIKIKSTGNDAKTLLKKLGSTVKLGAATGALLLALLPSLAHGQGLNSCPGVNLAPRVLGYQQITATGSAQKLTVPFGTLYATINVEGAASTNIRYREDGTAPTTSVGTLVPSLVTTASNVPPVYIVVCQNEVATFQFIAVAGSPILNVHFYGR